MHATRRYKCSACAKTYQRSAASEWTENPFHEWRGNEAALDAKCRAEAVQKLASKPCPRCGQENAPYA
jgi:hypothetical protein